jgi:hypothetical protein
MGKWRHREVMECLSKGVQPARGGAGTEPCQSSGLGPRKPREPEELQGVVLRA